MFEEVRGRYNKGRRGAGEDTQRVPDKGWEGIQELEGIRLMAKHK